MTTEFCKLQIGQEFLYKGGFVAVKKKTNDAYIPALSSAGLVHIDDNEPVEIIDGGADEK